METLKYKAVKSSEDSAKNLSEAVHDQEVSQAEQDAVKRHNEHFRTLFLMRYGEVPHDHPVYTYLQEILNRLPGVEGLGIKLSVIPDKFQANAYALPDDTLAVTSRLVEFSEYYEALAGVLAHEKVHIEKEHTKPFEEKRKLDYRNIVEFGLKRLAKGRLNEYEADLRAVFEDLEKAGINPLGFKVMLQKFAQREGYDDAHGSSMDRALNVATGSYLMDLKSLSSELHKIPGEVVESVKGVARPEYGAIFSRPKDYPGVFKPYKQRIEERRESIRRINDPDKLLIALNTVGNYCKQKDAKDHDPDDDVCMKKLIEKTTLHLQEKLGRIDRQSMLLLLSYFSAVPIVRMDTYLEYGTKGEKATISPAELFSKVATANVFQSALSHVPHYCTDLVTYLDAQGLLKKGDTTTLQSLDQAFYEMQNAYSIYAPVQKAVTIFTEQKFGKFIPHEESVVGEVATKPVWDKMKSMRSGQVYELLKTHIGSLDVDSVHKATAKIAKTLSKELVGKDLHEILSTVSDVNYIFTDYTSTYVVTSKEHLGKIPDSNAVLDRYVPLKVFFQCAKDLDLSKMIGKETYDVLRLLFIYEFGGTTLLRQVDEYMNAHSYFKAEREESAPVPSGTYEDDYGESEEDIDYIEEAMADIEQEDDASPGGRIDKNRQDRLTLDEEKMWHKIKDEIAGFSVSESVVLTNASVELIDTAYQVFVDTTYRKDYKLDELTSHLGPPSARGKDFFARLVDVYSAKISLPEFISFIHTNQEKYEHFTSTISASSQSLGNISEKISEAVADGTLWQLPLKSISTVSEFVHDPFIRSQILSKGLNENWAKLSFDEKVELLFPEKGRKGIVDFQLRERFLCEEVKTKEQYDHIKNIVGRSIDDLFNTTSVGVGGAVLADRISFKHSDPVRFLKSALMTSESDQALREWIEDLIHSGESLYYDDVPPENQGEKNTSLIGDHEFMIESIIQQLYNLDEVGRRMFVRKLLVGQDGLLRTARNREKFFDSIFDSWLKDEDGQNDLSEVLERIKASLAEEDSWELLYFAIQGILADKIFIPPRGTTTKVMRPDVVTAINKAKPTQRNREKVMLSTLRLRNTFESEGFTKARKQKISPVEFVKETAGNLGALGRRFLQVLPQFVELSPEYEREFSDVYDKVAGQSKFAALATVEREWPEMWDELNEVGDRVGGGSIVTVYHTVDKQGKEGVLKVRNPNILYHLDESQKVAISVADRLADKYGESYKQARDIIPDIDSWVTNDVNFTSFLEKDAQFRGQYQGFTVGGNTYKVRIPESVGPQNAYFSREEYIPGMNLTSIDEIIKSERHDAKQVISLLAKFYVQQIMDGRLHSDIHPGNFSVTENNELVVYDRNYYIDLTEQEREAILALFGPFADDQQKMEYMRTLLKAGEETLSLLKEFVTALSSGDIGQAKKEIIKIKSSGVVVPLNVTLLLKNISSIQALAKKVGFTSIFDAVMA